MPESKRCIASEMSSMTTLKVTGPTSVSSLAVNPPLRSSQICSATLREGTHTLRTCSFAISQVLMVCRDKISYGITCATRTRWIFQRCNGNLSVLVVRQQCHRRYDGTELPTRPALLHRYSGPSRSSWTFDIAVCHSFALPFSRLESRRCCMLTIYQAFALAMLNHYPKLLLVVLVRSNASSIRT
jgi:hypothetical protein